MKKILVSFFIITFAVNAFAQVVNDNTKRKFTFGLDVFTDFWQNIPKTLDPQTINAGVNVFGSYNYMFGTSNVSFSPGLGIGTHNLYSSSFLKANSTYTNFVLINDSIAGLPYKKSKLTVTYLDIPLELRYKSKSEFRVAIGFKFGFLLQAHTKYKGNDYVEGTNDRVIYKKAKIQNMEKNRYGFTFRIGYKWLNLWGYYQLSTLFATNKGPDMYPISLGLTIIPF